MFRFKAVAIAATVVALFSCYVPSTFGNLWVPTAGGSWATAANWSGPAAVPNASGAVAAFGANNSANRTITTDSGAAGFTVGSISFDLTGTGTFTNSVTTGTAGSNLKLNNGGSGVSITTTGTGTGNNTISVPLSLDDNVIATVNQTASSSGAGSLNLTATMSGTGGFTKAGDGLATFGTGTKTYTGATSVTGGRLRMSLAAAATGTSSFTINGGQLDIISAGSFTLGPGSLNLNGTGATTGPFAVFPGALRQDTNIAVTITNPVNLQSNSLIHVQGSASGSLTLSNVVSGVGKLTFTAPSSDANQGKLVLNGANTYSGGTLVQGGTLEVGGSAATLGTGNVAVDNALSTSSTAVLSILAGVTNAIFDGATLSLAGGGAAGVADQNYALLGAGINELVDSLILGGVAQVAGTYGSTLSSAMFKNNEYFSGTGIITVVPEPAAILCGCLVCGVLGLAAGGRRLAGKLSVRDAD